MSTRSTTHFIDGSRTDAIIYRHSDGYPEGAGQDIFRFLAECDKLDDPRLNDTSYLAAKYVVFLAGMFNLDYRTGQPKAQRLDFLSVGVVKKDPADIEYRYTIDCSGRRPVVKCYEVSSSESRKKEVALKPDADTGWTL